MTTEKPNYKPLAPELELSRNINSTFNRRNPTGIPTQTLEFKASSSGPDQSIQIQIDPTTGERTARDPNTGETLVVVEDTCPKCIIL